MLKEWKFKRGKGQEDWKKEEWKKRQEKKKEKKVISSKYVKRKVWNTALEYENVTMSLQFATKLSMIKSGYQWLVATTMQETKRIENASTCIIFVTIHFEIKVKVLSFTRAIWWKSGLWISIQ